MGDPTGGTNVRTSAAPARPADVVRSAIQVATEGLAAPSRVDDAVTIQRQLEERRRTIDSILESHLDAIAAEQPGRTELLRCVRYSLTAGGKRLRPQLVWACCRVAGGADQRAHAPMIAVEAIHTFSLIHDDLPAMDDDDLRRGRPTNHKVFGEALAILAGDWLVAHAFGVLVADPQRPETSQRMVAALVAGSLGMVEGQAADIEGEEHAPSAERVNYIHQNKTAALIEASCRLGAIAAGADTPVETALAGYGREIGLAFQIVDDLLDATSTTDQLGKRAGKDAEVSKQTYPAVHGIEASRQHAQEALQRALAALDTLEAAQSESVDWLRQLAQYVVARKL